MHNLIPVFFTIFIFLYRKNRPSLFFLNKLKVLKEDSSKNLVIAITRRRSSNYLTYIFDLKSSTILFLHQESWFEKKISNFMNPKYSKLSREMFDGKISVGFDRNSDLIDKLKENNVLKTSILNSFETHIDEIILQDNKVYFFTKHTSPNDELEKSLELLKNEFEKLILISNNKSKKRLLDKIVLFESLVLAGFTFATTSLITTQIKNSLFSMFPIDDGNFLFNQDSWILAGVLIFLLILVFFETLKDNPLWPFLNKVCYIIFLFIFSPMFCGLFISTSNIYLDFSSPIKVEAKITNSYYYRGSGKYPPRFYFEIKPINSTPFVVPTTIKVPANIFNLGTIDKKINIQISKGLFNRPWINKIDI
jgi:hypothetical protein